MTAAHQVPAPDYTPTVRLLARLTRIAEQACQRSGISLPQYRLLAAESDGPQRASALAEVRQYADWMLQELREVIPAFLRRVDREDRGVRWSRY